MVSHAISYSGGLPGVTAVARGVSFLVIEISTYNGQERYSKISARDARERVFHMCCTTYRFQYLYGRKGQAVCPNHQSTFTPEYILRTNM
jgi:hypothetical protein